MELFGRWNVFWRSLHSISTVGTVLLGVLGSVLAALHSAHTLAIIAGALIAGLTTFAPSRNPASAPMDSGRLS